MASHPLTPRQATLVKFIKRSVKKNGYGPSYDECAKKMKTVKSNIARMAYLLEDRKVITIIPGVHRSMRLTPTHQD